MLITAFRPTVTDYAVKAPTASQGTAAPADAFVSTSDNGRLNEVDAMAALAQAAKAKTKAELPEDLAAAVIADLGKSGITSFSDERVKTLNGYVRDGWESPFFDPLATLGEGWEEQKREVLPLFQPVVFTRQGQNVIQHISFDQKNGTTTLHTINAESFIRTRHHEIVEDREGKVVITDDIAH